MTANDRTGEKLVDSMRKTKAAAAGKDGVSGSERKEPRGQKPQPRTGRKGTTRQRSQAEKKRPVDPYQSGRRVWPD
ncbi:MAG TPA: hypothetical protein VKA76_07085 [Gammaproteobacteria bacterium]|nr:hypothetical protein [Gammaproteobacteria bacterium]